MFSFLAERPVSTFQGPPARTDASQSTMALLWRCVFHHYILIHRLSFLLLTPSSMTTARRHMVCSPLYPGTQEKGGMKYFLNKITKWLHHYPSQTKFHTWKLAGNCHTLLHYLLTTFDNSDYNATGLLTFQLSLGKQKRRRYRESTEEKNYLKISK